MCLLGVRNVGPVIFTNLQNVDFSVLVSLVPLACGEQFIRKVAERLASAKPPLVSTLYESSIVAFNNCITDLSNLLA
jgi:hypothetical protein